MARVMEDNKAPVTATDVKRYLGNLMGQRMSSRVRLTQAMIDRYNEGNPSRRFNGNPDIPGKQFWGLAHDTLARI